MNYKNVHDNIIHNAKSQTRCKSLGYYELHHIIPKCIRPDLANLKIHSENGVLLTGREHFIVHRLLAKMYPNTNLVHAPWKMACHDKDNKYKITARLYEHLRKEHARRITENTEANVKKGWSKGKTQSQQHVESRIQSRKLNGKPWHNDSVKEKISKANAGKVLDKTSRSFGTNESRARGVETRKRNNSYVWSDDQKQKASKSRKGVKTGPKSEDHKKALRKPKSKVSCPHCHLVGGSGIMKRWHFDNCKSRIDLD